MTVDEFILRLAKCPSRGCLIFRNRDGSRTTTRYPTARWEGMDYSTHRLAYMLFVGDIPDGLIVRHTCHVPHCCNPTHLLLGTQKQNVADRTAIGRTILPPQQGEKNGNAKVDDATVNEIRKLWATGEYYQSQLARMFGLSQPRISEIVNNKGRPLT